MIKCKTCEGSGKCSFCLGKGLVTRGFFSKTERDCTACGGIGRCAKCKGSGNVPGYSGIIVRIRCPKCGYLKDVFTRQRPLQVDCNCGTTLILKN